MTESEYRITDEELNRILLESPMSLPINPSDRGMKPEQIKKFFYGFIRTLIKYINSKNTNMKEYSDEGRNTASTSLSEHNLSGTCHADIRNLVSDLSSAISDFGDAISGKVDKEEGKSLSKNDFTDTYKGKIDNLNSSFLTFVKDKIKLVHDSANTLKYTLTVGDVSYEINIPKDQFLKNVSYNEESKDLSFVFTTATGEKTITVSLENLTDLYTAGDGIVLVNGQFGVNNTYLEGLYAKKTDFDSLESAVNGKEAKVPVTETTSSTVTLENRHEYNCGLKNELTLVLPTSVPNDYQCIVNFRSGATATTLSSDSGIVFTVDDCADGVFTPVANRLYEINIKKVNGAVIAKVGGIDYEVI